MPKHDECTHPKRWAARQLKTHQLCKWSLQMGCNIYKPTEMSINCKLEAGSAPQHGCSIAGLHTCIQTACYHSIKLVLG